MGVSRMDRLRGFHAGVAGVLVACLAAGVLVVAAASGALFGRPPAVRAATTMYTRSASCAGLDFYPTDSQTWYSNFGTARVWSQPDSEPGASGTFRCDPG